MKTPLPYPPPWQDAPTLCAHLCISETTLDNWVRQGILPPAKARGGKRMWKWSEVERFMEFDPGIVPEQDLARRVYDATKKAAANG
jgi:predicted site-specific integrase-resolvase